MASSDVKGFFREKKKTTKTKKESGIPSKKSSKPKNTASFGSNVAQPPALVARGCLDLQGLVFPFSSSLIYIHPSGQDL